MKFFVYKWKLTKELRNLTFYQYFSQRTYVSDFGKHAGIGTGTFVWNLTHAQQIILSSSVPPCHILILSLIKLASMSNPMMTSQSSKRTENKGRDILYAIFVDCSKDSPYAVSRMHISTCGR